MNGFEGSYMGDAARIDDATRLECGVCWWVYDPALGDEEWQIPAGVPFTALPGHWRCPKCDAEKSKFMVAGRSLDLAAETRDPILEEISARAAAVKAAYAAVDARMRALPIYNDALSVDVVGFASFGESEMIGVVVTPWAMNLLIAPLDASALGRPEGSKRFRALPSGEYEFVAGVLADVGPIETCSLFSPMEAFEDMAAARAVAEEAIVGAMAAPEPKPTPAMSRRALFAGAPAG